MKRFLFGFILLLIVPGLLGAQQGKVFSVFDKGVSVDLELVTLTVTGATVLEGTVTISGAVTINNTVAVNNAITATVSDAATTTVTDVLTLIHNTSGTPAAGLGTGLEFQVEDAGGDEEQGRIDVAMRTVTDGSEDANMIFKVNSAGGMVEGMRIIGLSGGGRVGINNTDPVQMLAVKAQAKSTNVIGVIQDTTTAGVILLGEASGSQGQIDILGHDHVVDITLKADGSDSFIKEGDFGLGDTTPDYPFEILSTTTPQFAISNDDGNDYATFDVSTAGLLTITTVDQAAALGHIALMPDGNVGIGTASPAHLLHLSGGNIALGDTTTGDVDAIIYFADDASVTAESFSWDDGSDKFIFSNDIQIAGTRVIGTNSTNTYIDIDNLWVTGSTDITIDPDEGSVGILTLGDTGDNDTTRVVGEFDVSNDISGDADSTIQILTDASINKPAGDMQFDVASGTLYKFGENGSDGIQIDAGGGRIQGATTSNFVDLNDGIWQTASTDMKIDPDEGSVGILQLGDTGDNDTTRVVGEFDVSGRVAVGATNPTAELAVTGDIVSDTYNFAADSQGDDDYEIALPDITSLTTGLMVVFTANTANTDGATLEITSVGDLDAILKMHDQALATGDIEAGQVVVCVFDGTNWQMTSQLAQ